MKKYTFVDYLVQKEKAQKKIFKNYLNYAKKIKKIAQDLLGEVKVFIFGSVLKKNKIPNDIDILIISPQFKDYRKKREFRVKMWEKFGDFFPFEFHLVTPEEYQNWYQKFIKEKIEI